MPYFLECADPTPSKVANVNAMNDHPLIGCLRYCKQRHLHLSCECYSWVESRNMIFQSHSKTLLLTLHSLCEEQLQPGSP